MTQPKNQKRVAEERVRIHGINAIVEMSPRGHVYVRAVGRQAILEDMDPALKYQLELLPYEGHVPLWQAEMAKLRDRAIARARREWKTK